MNEQTNKNKSNPFKILVFLLYGEYQWLTHGPNQRAEIRIGPLARMLRTKNDRCKGYLQWLADCGYITDLSFEWGKAIATLPEPPKRAQDSREAFHG